MAADAQTVSSLPASSLPSSGVRGLISYLLFIHFFFLLVGVKSNTSSSGLDQDLRNKVPGLKPYLQLTAMDLSYMFHLTYYDGENRQDTDYWYEADVPQADGSRRTVRLEPLGLALPVRNHRYGRLAFVSGYYVEGGDEGLTSLLPRGVARRIMLEQNCRELTIRLRRRLLQNLMLPAGDPRAAADRGRDPDDPSYFQTVYEAFAYTNDAGEVELVSAKAASDTAAPKGTTPQPRAKPSTTPPAAAASSSAVVPPAASSMPTFNPSAPVGPSLLPPLPSPSGTTSGGSRP